MARRPFLFFASLGLQWMKLLGTRSVPRLREVGIDATKVGVGQ